MTVLDAPVTDADLEALYALDGEPQYVALFLPPWIYMPAALRQTQPGWWELRTVEDFDANRPAADEWTIAGGPGKPADELAAWAGTLLGCPVTLQPDTYLVKAPGAGGHWTEQPLYLVRRNT